MSKPKRIDTKQAQTAIFSRNNPGLTAGFYKLTDGSYDNIFPRRKKKSKKRRKKR
jgi:hypothetical protein